MWTAFVGMASLLIFSHQTRNWNSEYINPSIFLCITMYKYNILQYNKNKDINHSQFAASLVVLNQVFFFVTIKMFVMSCFVPRATWALQNTVQTGASSRAGQQWLEREWTRAERGTSEMECHVICSPAATKMCCWCCSVGGLSLFS